ncbi:MAG: hypothetical protein HGB35_05520, partial [Geobacteraceae bacterium]|nr:hypothetical protein [Geobacteraceae bacterium]
MCGIFGIVTEKEQALGPILIEAARRLTYRGYDSVGAATISGAKIDLRKDVGRVDEVAARYNLAEMTGQRGITQLRWATFGEPSQINSQPHLDSDGDLVGAHNGNVVNNVELRLEFMAEGLTVRLAPVAAQPGAKPALADSTATDKFGAYKLMVKEPGKCLLTLVYEKQTATLAVFRRAAAELGHAVGPTGRVGTGHPEDAVLVAVEGARSSN